jgi:NAD(P)-dependent dehydrogenase (short-subunit alcohol dehydrogenase family)
MIGEVRALVVGATGGIGRRVALAIAEPGMEIAVHGRVDDERMTTLCSDLRARGAEPQSVIRNVQRAEDLTGTVDELLPIDVLVVSLGPMMRASMEETGVEDWRRMAELNFVMPSVLVSRCLPSMKARNFGRVLLFGGTRTDQLRGFRTIAAYSAAKTALGSVVKSAARQCAGFDICINALCPGYVDTEYYDEVARERARSAAPGGRMLDPAEVASAAAGLLSRENRGLTGAVVPIDGGMG